MKLAVRKDVGTPRQPGQFAHSKSWLVPLDSAARTNLSPPRRAAPTARLASCGIGAEDVDGEESEGASSIKAMKLGAAAYARLRRRTARSA